MSFHARLYRIRQKEARRQRWGLPFNTALEIEKAKEKAEQNKNRLVKPSINNETLLRPNG